MSWRIPGRRYGLLYCSKESVTLGKEIDGVCVIQVFIAWVGSVPSLDVVLDDLSTSTAWGLHDLHEVHIRVNRTYMCRD